MSFYITMEKNDQPKTQGKSILWPNLLHFYQPPDQDRGLIERIVNEAYQPVITLLENIKSARATVNIPACTVELLIKTGFGELITRLKGLAETGRIELTLTPRFHLIMPIYPEEEVERQIASNYKLGKRYFGYTYTPRGLYSPELAYETTVAKTAVRHGCRWLAVDEIAINGNLGQAIFDKLYMDKSAGGLILVPRNRRLSEGLAGSLFARDDISSADDFAKLALDSQHRFVFTAVDVEHFGHHIKDRHGLLSQLYQHPQLVPLTVSELLSHIRKKDYCRPRASDWTSTPEELKNRQLFYTWNDPQNKIHQTLWELYRLATDEIKNAAAAGDLQHIRAREALSAAAPSCGLFWASCRPWWYGVYPENMATNICLALFSLMAPSAKAKDKAFKLRQTIYDLVAEYNQNGTARKLQIDFLKSRGINSRKFFERG